MSKRDKYPEIRVEQWWTAHATLGKQPAVALHFVSGQMESALHFTAEGAIEIAKALTNSAKLSIDKIKAGGEQ